MDSSRQKSTVQYKIKWYVQEIGPVLYIIRWHMGVKDGVRSLGGALLQIVKHSQGSINILYIGFNCQTFLSPVAVSSWFTPVCCSSLCCCPWGWMESSSGATGLFSPQYGCGSCWSLLGPLWAPESGLTTPSTGRPSYTWTFVPYWSAVRF